MSRSVYIPRNAGFTLVELMIAMLIGVVLMGGVIQIFASSKQTYRTQDELGRTQENARYAMEVLLKDIRMAGYMGCFGQTAVNDIVKPALKPVGGDFFDDPVVGYDGQSSSGTALTDWNPNLPAYFSAGDAVAGSDVLVIQRVLPFNTDMIGNLAPSNANIQIDTNPNNEIAAGDTLMLTDCRDTDIFMANNVSSSGGTVTIAHSSSTNTASQLSKVYQADARLMRLVMSGYYVGTNADGNSALFRTSISTNGVMAAGDELVEGVETMQISYGEDMTGDGMPNRYIAANNITDTDNIVTVRIGLLMYSTDDNVAPKDDDRTFNLAGTDVSDSGTVPLHGGDKSLRQAYTTTIKIRNRGMQ